MDTDMVGHNLSIHSSSRLRLDHVRYAERLRARWTRNLGQVTSGIKECNFKWKFRWSQARWESDADKQGKSVC